MEEARVREMIDEVGLDGHAMAKDALAHGIAQETQHNLIEVRALVAALAEDADNWETMNEELEKLDEHQLTRLRRVLDVLLSHTVRVRATKRLHP